MSSSDSMKAVRLNGFGDKFSTLKVETIPKPVLSSPDQVLIHVKASAVNMSDIKETHGLFPYVKPPVTTGRDFSGVIVDWHSLSTSENILAKGTEVWGSGGDFGYTMDGGHAEYIVVEKNSIRSKPHNLSFEEAASVGTTYVTAWGALEHAKVAPFFNSNSNNNNSNSKIGNEDNNNNNSTKTQQTIAVFGANGQVGSAVMQLCKWKGLKTIGVVRKSLELELKERLNADVIIDTSNEDLKNAIMRVTDGKGVNIIYDTIGAPMLEAALSILAKEGTLIEISTPPSQRQVTFDLLDFYRRNLSIVGYNSIRSSTEISTILDKLLSGFEGGHLKPPKELFKFSLDDSIKAFEATTEGKRAIIVPGL